MLKGQKLLPNAIHPAPKEFEMYAVFRGPKDRYPEVIYNRARDAKHLVFENKTYWWGKESFYRRIVIKMKKVTLYDVYKHERKII